MATSFGELPSTSSQPNHDADSSSFTDYALLVDAEHNRDAGTAADYIDDVDPFLLTDNVLSLDEEDKHDAGPASEAVTGNQHGADSAPLTEYVLSPEEEHKHDAGPTFGAAADDYDADSSSDVDFELLPDREHKHRGGPAPVAGSHSINMPPSAAVIQGDSLTALRTRYPALNLAIPVRLKPEYYNSNNVSEDCSAEDLRTFIDNLRIIEVQDIHSIIVAYAAGGAGYEVYSLEENELSPQLLQQPIELGRIYRLASAYQLRLSNPNSLSTKESLSLDENKHSDTKESLPLNKKKHSDANLITTPRRAPGIGDLHEFFTLDERTITTRNQILRRHGHTEARFLRYWNLPGDAAAFLSREILQPGSARYPQVDLNEYDEENFRFCYRRRGCCSSFLLVLGAMGGKLLGSYLLSPFHTFFAYGNGEPVFRAVSEVLRRAPGNMTCIMPPIPFFAGCQTLGAHPAGVSELFTSQGALRSLTEYPPFSLYGFPQNNITKMVAMGGLYPLPDSCSGSLAYIEPYLNWLDYPDGLINWALFTSYGLALLNTLTILISRGPFSVPARWQKAISVIITAICVGYCLGLGPYFNAALVLRLILPSDIDASAMAAVANTCNSFMDAIPNEHSRQIRTDYSYVGLPGAILLFLIAKGLDDLIVLIPTIAAWMHTSDNAGFTQQVRDRFGESAGATRIGYFESPNDLRYDQPRRTCWSRLLNRLTHYAPQRLFAASASSTSAFSSASSSAVSSASSSTFATTSASSSAVSSHSSSTFATSSASSSASAVGSAAAPAVGGGIREMVMRRLGFGYGRR